MSYVVLARKYRPRDFAEMIGQEHVLQALQHAIAQQRLHHAYLFTGTRGVGKTTVARVFAKCLNCERGLSAHPCNDCATCQEIDQGRYIDLLEIDAASRTKVEDTRDLLENVQYSPQAGRFKIYLIDEVHMLSNHSFNALLKTLEEPPPHVKFLLATTDPQRLPVTVLSRCLQFHLKNLSPAQIVSQMTTILNKENINYDVPALSAIAKAAKGSMRDALSLLDQCLAYGNGKITDQDVSVMLGLISEQKILELLNLLQQQNTTQLLQKIDELAELGADFMSVLDDILLLFQRIAVAQILQKADSDIEVLSTLFTPEDIQLYYQIGVLGKRDMPLAPDPKAGFIMIMIRMLAFTPITGSAGTEKSASINSSKVNPVKTYHTPPARKAIDGAIPEHLSSAVSQITVTSTALNWPTLVAQLGLTGLAHLLANNCTLVSHNEQHIELLLDENHATLLNPSAQERLTKALQSYLGNTCKVTITIGKSAAQTPAQLEQQKQVETKQRAQEKLLNDPHVQSLMEKFSATLQPESLVAKEVSE